MDAHRGEVDPQFSSPGATPTPWAAVREQLETAKTYWLSTVRPDGRPHVTTIAGVWLDEAVHFVTGPSERKAKNVAAGNSHAIVTTGCNGWDGLDIVVEGEAVPVIDADRLRRLVEAFAGKYDDFFGYRLQDGRLHATGAADAPVPFELRATKAFAFAKGETFSQTRWRFPVRSTSDEA
jgi:hypothetical protein